jgi:hypothetical protein
MKIPDLVERLENNICYVMGLEKGNVLIHIQDLEDHRSCPTYIVARLREDKKRVFDSVYSDLRHILSINYPQIHLKKEYLKDRVLVKAKLDDSVTGIYEKSQSIQAMALTLNRILKHVKKYGV